MKRNKRSSCRIRSRLRYLGAVIAVGLLFAACQKEDAMSNGIPLATLRFSVETPAAKGSATRGIPVSTGAFHPSFTVFAAVYPDGGWNEACEFKFMERLEAMKQSGDIYATEDTYYLPGKGKSLRFFALAPHGVSPLHSNQLDENGDVISVFFQKLDVKEHIDLCYTRSGEIKGDGNGSVPLHFEHALTGVRFKTGTVPTSGTIRSITITNCNTGMQLVLPKDYSKKVSWTSGIVSNNYPSSTDYTVDADVALTGKPGQEITTEEETFMLFPEPTDSQIKILYDPDSEMNSGDERELIAPLDWSTYGKYELMGKLFIYNISFLHDKLELSSTIVPWNTTPPTIEGGAEKPVPTPEVGNFYYSDGTWSPVLDAGKTVIGIVCQTDPARIGMAERKALAAVGVAEPHGLVMALKDASVAAAWATTNADIPALTNSMTLKGNYDDCSGLANCNAVRTLDGDFSDYPAFRAACVEFAKQVPPPVNTTGWYLPAFGQWWDIFTHVAGADLSSLEASEASNSYLFTNTDMSGQLNANASLSQIGDGEKDRFMTAGYASSTEASDTQYCNWQSMYIGSNALGFNRTTKSSASRVRAVLAF